MCHTSALEKVGELYLQPVLDLNGKVYLLELITLARYGPENLAQLLPQLLPRLQAQWKYWWGGPPSEWEGGGAKISKIPVVSWDEVRVKMDFHKEK